MTVIILINIGCFNLRWSVAGLWERVCVCVFSYCQFWGYCQLLVFYLHRQGNFRALRHTYAAKGASKNIDYRQELLRLKLMFVYNTRRQIDTQYHIYKFAFAVYLVL